MAEQDDQPGELALVKAVRTLDHGGSGAIPDKLDQIWKILSIYTRGRFHAAEEMLVRWLLKNMNGSSTDAEKLRRYPLTWRILAKLFSSTPLFSLAKSLADRRFISILQTSLKDASEPKEVAEQRPTSDTEMVDAESDEAARPRKRKRSETVHFDLESQAGRDGCLRTAEALFESVRRLLARLEPTATGAGKRATPVGAEHIKSLFCSSASDIKDIIVPALKICQLYVHTWGAEDGFDGQEAWISTICDVWGLHLQDESDAFQVAAHFSSSGIDVLGRIYGIPDETQSADLPLDSVTRQHWGHDLERFLSRNLILPARTAFLNTGVLDIISISLEITAGFSTVACPVIFYLAVSSARLAGGPSKKSDNEAWIQAVFSVLDETLQASKHEQRLAAVKYMISLVRKHDVSLSLESLRSLCKTYALQPKNVDWSFLVEVATLNPDVFIIGEGDGLLQTVFDLITTDGPDDIADESGERGAPGSEQQEELIQAIATGFARARDLSGFVKKWFHHLASVEPHIVSETRRYRAWYNEKLCGIVAHSLESSMNIKQILSLLDWLDSQDQAPASDATVILLLDALSRGITQDDVVDSVGMRLFEMASKRSLPSPVNAKVLARRWAVARRSLEWATLEQGHTIWTSSARDLAHTLEMSPISQADVFDAFKFSTAAWVVNHPGGEYEDDAAALTIRFMSRLEGRPSPPATRPLQQLASTDPVTRPVQKLITDYLVAGSPRLLSLILERDENCCPTFFKTALSFGPDGDAAKSKERALALFANERNLNSRATINVLLNSMMAGLRTEGSGTEAFGLLAEALLAVPIDVFSRERRERIMGLLIAAILAQAREGSKQSMRSLEPIVSLMIRLMQKPTFYANMAFSDLDSVATAIAISDGGSALPYLALVEQLALLTTEQMTANVGPREEEYFRQAVSSMEQQVYSTVGDSGDLAIFRIVLIKMLVLAIQESGALKGISSLDIGGLERRLIQMIKAVVDQFCSTWEATPFEDLSVSSVSVAVEAADDVYRHKSADELAAKLAEALSPYLTQLRMASEALGSVKGFDVWALRRFLAKSSARFEPLPLDRGNATDDGVPDADGILADIKYGNKLGIMEYVDDALTNTEDHTRLEHIRTLLVQRADVSNQDTHLFAVYRIVQQLAGKSAPRSTSEAQDTFDLATAHTMLCKRLRSSESPTEFVLITQILETMLDGGWHSMTQWNIELTLSTVSILASQSATHAVVSCTPKAYERLCRLVQVIVRRHRLRLEGHFHVLVTVLQSLLRSLLCHPYDRSGHAWTAGLIKDASAFRRWEKHARAFARLLTMVCEPTPGSVSRPQQHSLDSATDTAKRYAGQHAYLVLMLYIRLQLEQNVPHGVRAALEPGVFAILDITTPEGRRIMNDALDGSGRAIMKELYKQYLKFGKWSGV